MIARSLLFASVATLVACGAKVLPNVDAIEDARIERSADGSSTPDEAAAPTFDATSVDEGPLCFADFPCQSWQRWRCDDAQHARAFVTRDCHYRCGPGPCSGASCELADGVTTCPSGTHCVEELPPYADGGGTTLDGPCQKLETSDAGSCPPGETTVYEGPGCDGKNRHCAFYDPTDACAAITYFCTCDGKTTIGVCGSTTQQFAYVAPGPCPGGK